MGQNTTLPWQGFHHVALKTKNLDQTVAFYRDTLGMHAKDIISTTVDNREERRHCVILVKPEDPTTLGFHFWEYSDDTDPTSLRSSDQALMHIAIRLASEQEAASLRQRLEAHDIKVKNIPELHSFLFTELNGIMLEVLWPAA